MKRPITQPRNAQFRGPTTSDDYNARIEENYHDLLTLFNAANSSEVHQQEMFRRILRENEALSRIVGSLEHRLDVLESGLACYLASINTSDLNISSDNDLVIIDGIEVELGAELANIQLQQDHSIDKFIESLKDNNDSFIAVRNDLFERVDIYFSHQFDNFNEFESFAISYTYYDSGSEQDDTQSIELETQVKVLTEGRSGASGLQRITFFDNRVIDNNRFVGNETFEIDQPDQLTVQSLYGLMTLPLVESASLSKLFFVTGDGHEILPSMLEVRAVGNQETADTTQYRIDQSPPEMAVYRTPGTVWERNIAADQVHVAGAEVQLYVRVPTDLFTTEKSNAIVVHPYPSFGASIKSVEYTLSPNATLRDDDDYVPVNSSQLHSNNMEAVGWIAPGGWSGTLAGLDTIHNSGPKTFYFPPKAITGLRITLHQDTYRAEAGHFVYSYGMSRLDLRYDKFLPEGKSMVRFDAPPGETISNVHHVTPKIWNVPLHGIVDAFSYRVVWETSFDSGEYTLDPQPNSSRVWIEVAMNNDANRSPALAGLEIEYS